MARQYGISGSGDSGGGYIDIPDQPESGGGQMPAQPDYGAAQRDQIAQAMMAQQAQRAQQMQWAQTPSFAQGGSGSGGGNPSGGATAESAALMLQDPSAYYAKYGGAPDYHGMSPQEYGSYFTPRPMPSGGVDEQSPKLFAWGGYSDAGRAPGGELPFYGNGAAAYANPNYWFGSGAGAQSLRGGYNGGPATLESQMLMLQNPAAYYERYGGGPGNSGAAGMGDMGGMSGGSTGISDAEMGKAIADVNSQRGNPDRGSPDRGDPTTGWGANATGFNDYGAPAGPLGYGTPGSFGNNQGFNQGGPTATQGQPSAGTAFGPNGWGGFGLGATGLAGTVAFGNNPAGSVIGSMADAMNAAQAAQDTADDAEADAADL